MPDKKQTVTVFGAGGFIGSHLVALLQASGIACQRGDWSRTDFNHEDLGTVIFCGGVGDCREVDKVIFSHVDIVRHVINSARYDFLLYVSSTRLYLGNETSDSAAPVTCYPEDKRVLFNQVKLLAETLIKSQPQPFAVVRPSNVYGSAYSSPLFLPSLVRDAVTKGEINLYVAADYSKDYVYVDDVVNAIKTIAVERHQGVFNIASGENVSARELVDCIVAGANCKVNWHDAWSDDAFPEIDITALKQKIDFKPKRVISMLDEMIDVFKNKFSR